MRFYFVLCAILVACHAKVYFKEDFNDKNWEKRWIVPSDWKPKSELGEWKWTQGENFADASDKGIQTGEDAKFYGLSQN